MTVVLPEHESFSKRDMKDERKQAIARHYDTHWESWNDVYHGQYDSANTSFEVLHRRGIILQLLDQYAGNNSLKTIDIGCGTGVLMRDILERGHDVVGLDISENMVRAAQEFTATRFPGKSACLVGDIESLPFQSESFDCVICAGVLSHQPSDHDSIAEISRVVKKGGILLITLPNLVKLQNLLDLYYYCLLLSRLSCKVLSSNRRNKPGVREFIRDNGFPIRKYYYGQLNDLYHRNGFVVQETVSCGFGPLTFWKKALFPSGWSMTLFGFLEESSKKRGLSFLKPLANSWVIQLEKVR